MSSKDRKLPQRCPDCGAELQRFTSRLHCPACNKDVALASKGDLDLLPWGNDLLRRTEELPVPAGYWPSWHEGVLEWRARYRTHQEQPLPARAAAMRPDETREPPEPTLEDAGKVLAALRIAKGMLHEDDTSPLQRQYYAEVCEALAIHESFFARLQKRGDR